MAQVEMKIGSFFVCDEANIAPSSTFMFDPDKLDEINFAAIIRKVREKQRGDLDGGPFTNLREMENDEVTAYLDSEDQ